MRAEKAIFSDEERNNYSPFEHVYRRIESLSGICLRYCLLVTNHLMEGR